MTYEETLQKIIIVAGLSRPTRDPEWLDQTFPDGTTIREIEAGHQALIAEPEMKAKMLLRITELAEHALATNGQDEGHVPQPCCHLYGLDGHVLGHPPWY